jgi:hypothetical protein
MVTLDQVLFEVGLSRNGLVRRANKDREYRRLSPSGMSKIINEIRPATDWEKVLIKRELEKLAIAPEVIENIKELRG